MRGSAGRRAVFRATPVAVVAILIPVLATAAYTSGGTATGPATWTINWDGGAATNEWNDAANWDTDTLPGPADDVCIAAGAPGTTVAYAHAVNTQIASLSSGKPLGVSLGVLTVTGPATLDTLTLSAGTAALNGATTIGELEQTDGGMTGSGPVTASSLHWTGGTESGIGTTTVSGSGLGLRIDGTAVKTITHRDLVSNGPAGLWQSGTINLTDGGRI